MKKTLYTIALLFSYQATFAQMAEAKLFIQVNHVFQDNCYENSEEEWTSIAEYTTTFGNTTNWISKYMQCDNDNSCLYGQNEPIGNELSSGSSVRFRITGWEDDSGFRFEYDTPLIGDGDDCYELESRIIDYRKLGLPSADFINQSDLFNIELSSGNLEVGFDVYWYYYGSESLITATINNQTETLTSGNIRSNSILLTAGKTYRFEAVSGGDSFLRLYSSNGHTIVAVDDNSGTGDYAKIIYTANTTGWYYIETSELNRGHLFSDVILEYQEYSTVINQDCANATIVNQISTTAGNTSGTTIDNAPTCSTVTNSTGGGLWYKIIGTGSTATVETSNTSFDTKLRVFKGDCNNLICVAGNDDIHEDFNTDSRVEFCTEKDEIYYILVAGYQNDEGSFDLEVELYTPVMASGLWNVSEDSVCKGSEVSISTWGGTEAKWWTDGYEQNQIDTGAVLTITPNQTTTYYQTVENECGMVFYMGEKEIYVNGTNIAPDATANLAEDSASYTCTVNDNEWHYFYSEYNQLLGAINSHNQDLGNVTITAKPHDFSLSGIGNCSNTSLNNGEFSLPRNWEITGTNAITNPVDVIFYYESSEVQELTDTIANLTNNTDYVNCWGDVTGESDLMMTVENTDGTTSEFLTLNPTVGPASGQRQISFQISKYGKGRLHSNGYLSSLEDSDLLNIISGFYPNPTKNETQISYRLNQSSSLSIQIYDGVGRLIESRNISATNNVGSISFNTKEYSNGIYTAKIIINNKIVTRKLVINK